MLHHEQGNAPGIATPKSDNGLTTPHSQPAKIITKHATYFIASYGRIKGAMAGFYLDRGIGLDSIVMAILMAVFAAMRGCHEL
jgi:hypothetical protein